MAENFFIGAEPFLFKIRGGPVPQYYRDTNKHLQELAEVYDGGPLADPNIHVAWQLYYHIIKLREMLDDEVFCTNMRRLHNAPYEMLSVRGSVLLWKKLKEAAQGWDNADGPGSLKRICDEARRQEREDEGLYVSDGEVQQQRNEVVYISGDEDGDFGDAGMSRRKTNVYHVIPMDPLEMNGSKDKGPSLCITHSRRASGRRPGSDADEIDEAHPKKRKLKCHLTPQDWKRLPLPEREKYLMSLPGKRKARTRCENCEKLDLNCFLPAATDALPNPACIQCRARYRGCSARKITSRPATSYSSVSSQVHSRAHTSDSEIDGSQIASSNGL